VAVASSAGRWLMHPSYCSAANISSITQPHFVLGNIARRI
jgi:hypothetical protein